MATSSVTSEQVVVPSSGPEPGELTYGHADQVGGSKSLDDVDNSPPGRQHAMMGKQLDDSISKIAGIYAWADPLVNGQQQSAVQPRPALYGIGNDLNMSSTAYEDGTLTKLSDLGQKLETSTGSDLDEVVPGLGRRSMMRRGGAPARRCRSGRHPRSSPARRTASPSSRMPVATCRWGPDARSTDARHRSGMTRRRHPAGDERDGAIRRWRVLHSAELLTSPSFRRPRHCSSPRRHTARYWCRRARSVQYGGDGSGAEIIRPPRAHAQQPRWPTPVSMVGFSVAQRDIRDYYNGDRQWIMIVTLIACSSSWRCCCAPVAPIYLLLGDPVLRSDGGTASCSFNSCWGNSFRGTCLACVLVLVAVGADYNC